jgi:hypothetical protein
MIPEATFRTVWIKWTDYNGGLHSPGLIQSYEYTEDLLRNSVKEKLSEVNLSVSCLPSG